MVTWGERSSDILLLILTRRAIELGFHGASDVVLMLRSLVGC